MQHLLEWSEMFTNLFPSKKSPEGKKPLGKPKCRELHRGHPVVLMDYMM
jgi:hypothetical protein